MWRTNVWATRRLTTLNVSNNALSSLPSLSALRGLTTLDVSHNQLTQLSALPTPGALTSLLLSDNQLTALDGVESLLYLVRPWLFFSCICV